MKRSVGEGWGGGYRDFQVLTRQGLSEKKAENLKEVRLRWINGGRKDCGLMVVNSCFEDLEGRVGLKRVWVFVPKAGKEKKETPPTCLW